MHHTLSQLTGLSMTTFVGNGTPYGHKMLFFIHRFNINIMTRYYLKSIGHLVRMSQVRYRWKAQEVLDNL